jgi:uncharacterized membrane protein YphA (DoxX/SURF4 family)
MRLTVAAILLVAAGMKAHQLATMPSLGEGMLHARWFNILTVQFELLFGIWLIFGLLPKLTWLATVGCFSVFTLVTLYKALSGEESCGCFGTVTVDPQITLVFDLTVLGMLLWLRPSELSTRWQDMADGWQVPRNRKMASIALGLWVLMSVPTTYTMISVKTFDVSEFGTKFVGIDGRTTIRQEP